MKKFTSIEYQFCLSIDEGTKYDNELDLNDEELQQVFEVLEANPKAKFSDIPTELYKAFMAASVDYAVEDGLPLVEGAEIMLQPNMPEDFIELFEESKKADPKAEKPAENQHDEFEGKHILNLPLKKQWFDMIKSGEKKEEYREMSDFWHKRLIAEIDDEEETVYFWNYDLLRFTLGYPKAEETDKIMYFECDGITFDTSDHPEWGGNPEYPTFIIKIGKRVK